VVVVIVVVAKRCFCINWSLFTGCAFLVERAKLSAQLKKTERFLTLNEYIVVLHPHRQRCPFFTCLHFQMFFHIFEQAQYVQTWSWYRSLLSLSQFFNTVPAAKVPQ
jgi:hypothetical protein